MRYLLNGVAIIAALAIPSLTSAQRMGPGYYAYTGTGPGVTPPGGFGPSSTALFNVPEASPSLPPGAVTPGMAPRPAATTHLPSGAISPAVYPQSR